MRVPTEPVVASASGFAWGAGVWSRGPWTAAAGVWSTFAACTGVVLTGGGAILVLIVVLIRTPVAGFALTDVKSAPFIVRKPEKARALGTAPGTERISIEKFY